MRFLSIVLAALFLAASSACVSSTMYTSRIEETHPPVGEYVEVNGHRVHVIRDGEAGPVIVLVHGASANAREFQTTLVPALESGFRVLSMDRPGHGFSERPDNATQLEVQARQIAGAIEALVPGEKVIVVGHSFGGAVALRIGLERPDLVQGLVLLAPVTHDWGGGGVAWYNQAAAPALLGPLFAHIVPFVGPRQVGAGIKDVFAPEPVPEGYYEASAIGLLFRPRTFRANARDLVNLQDELAAQSARYGELSVPVVVFSGEADTVIKPELHVWRLVKDAPDVTVEAYAEVGHMPHHSKGPEIVAAISRLAVGAPAP